MLRLLRWLITGSFHEHKWEEVATGNIIDVDCNPLGRWYDCRCPICGSMKRFSLKQ